MLMRFAHWLISIRRHTYQRMFRSFHYTSLFVRLQRVCACHYKTPLCVISLKNPLCVISQLINQLILLGTLKRSSNMPVMNIKDESDTSSQKTKSRMGNSSDDEEGSNKMENFDADSLNQKINGDGLIVALANTGR
ncbi:uncharacterized protein LOC117102145 isoform X2 [Anneissia japonica]|uniref:uncharacterized protein LOC117102145 isoform X2 n=1 Tax=Anneissia japonica TaxID=1529436 RepID=UPI00142597A9|nr:uncharacterized protein LOC117102145 isoform X2 [Anneissia japonica]